MVWVSTLHIPVVSIVVPFWGYLVGSLLYMYMYMYVYIYICIWLNQKQELQWRLLGTYFGPRSVWICSSLYDNGDNFDLHNQYPKGPIDSRIKYLGFG